MNVSDSETHNVQDCALYNQRRGRKTELTLGNKVIFFLPGNKCRVLFLQFLSYISHYVNGLAHFFFHSCAIAVSQSDHSYQ